MVKTTIIAVIWLLLGAICFAQTYVSGPVSDVWTLAGSPYYVTDTIYVSEYDTLEIEAGVEVIFQGYFPFNVGLSALFSAIGSPENPIKFFPEDTLVKWCGLRLNNCDDNSILYHCTFEHGLATGEWPDECGGGVYMRNTDLLFKNCIVRNCQANFGGGIYISFGHPVIDGNIIIDNHAVERAGGLGTDNAEPTITNNVICDNSCEGDGGGILWWHFRGASINNTICNNTAETYGGGISAGNLPFVTLLNTIMFNNVAGIDENEIAILADDTIYAAYSILDTFECRGIKITGPGWSNDCPIFIADPVYPFMQDGTSPGVDTGFDSIYVPYLDTTFYAPVADLREYIRPWNGNFDMGAYETGSITGMSDYRANNLPDDLTITAYPNPFNSALTITAPAGAEIDVFDVNGRLIHVISMLEPVQNDNFQPNEKSLANPPEISRKARNDNVSEFVWQPDESLGSGVYLIRASVLGEGHGVQPLIATHRVVYLK